MSAAFLSSSYVPSQAPLSAQPGGAVRGEDASDYDLSGSSDSFDYDSDSSFAHSSASDNFENERVSDEDDCGPHGEGEYEDSSFCSSSSDRSGGRGGCMDGENSNDASLGSSDESGSGEVHFPRSTLTVQGRARLSLKDSISLVAGDDYNDASIVQICDRPRKIKPRAQKCFKGIFERARD